MILRDEEEQKEEVLQTSLTVIMMKKNCFERGANEKNVSENFKIKSKVRT